MPEPSTLLLLGSGMAALGWFRRNVSKANLHSTVLPSALSREGRFYDWTNRSRGRRTD
ncbi:MAG: PEP-CTERM sorting domain-containing protein [Nitrospirota bacterium]|nr:PEP-CTERM sorting domain-containing protein [Nitrospirota bacterium]